MGSMLGVALLLHFVAVMGYVVLSASAGRSTFFSDPGRLEVQGVELVSLSGVGPRPEGARPSSPSAPRSRPQVKATQAPTRSARTAPRAVSAPTRPVALAPRIPASQTSSGPLVAPYRPGPTTPTAVGNRPSAGYHGQGGTGTGAGSGVGQGGNGLGQGGSGTGGGGHPGPQGGSGPPRRLSATAQYTSTGFLDLQKQDVRLPDGREPRTWEELCTFLGLPISSLYSRSHVSPFMTKFPFVAYSRADMEAMVGRLGKVTVKIAVSKEGKPTAAITVSSGDPIMDRTAYAIASSTHWLPAMENGHPIDETVEFPITFDEGTQPGIYVRAAPPSQPGQGQIPSSGGQAPVSVPGGAGQMPTGIPGGAGKPPGSF